MSKYKLGVGQARVEGRDTPSNMNGLCFHEGKLTSSDFMAQYSRMMWTLLRSSEKKWQKPTTLGWIKSLWSKISRFTLSLEVLRRAKTSRLITLSAKLIQVEPFNVLELDNVERCRAAAAGKPFNKTRQHKKENQRLRRRQNNPKWPKTNLT